MNVNQRKINMIKNISTIAQAEFCVTSVCNLKCTHCYQANDKNQYCLDFKKIIDCVDFAHLYGCKKFVLSGGEYFTYPKAYELIDYILSQNNSEIAIATNSLLINFDLIKRFDNKRLKLKISLDGDESHHDERRGSGTFYKTIENIKKLKELGFFVGITTTLIESNLQCIPYLLDNPLFDEVTFMPVAKVGAAEKYLDISNDSKEYDEIIKLIYTKHNNYRAANFRCNMFPHGFSIKYNGDIYGCSLLRDYGLLKIGNINEGDIKSQFQNFLSSSESDKFFDYETNLEINECIKCKANSICSRGCRARALKSFGSFLKPDPFSCKLFNNQYPSKCFGEVYWGIMDN